MATLTITPETAYPIVLKARQFDAKVPQTDPDSGSNPGDDGSVDALEFGPADDTQAELESAISDLNDDEQRDLVALILVGRGDFSRSEWHGAQAAAAEIDRAHIAHFVTGIPLVSDFLEEGLSQFGESISDYLDTP